MNVVVRPVGEGLGANEWLHECINVVVCLLGGWAWLVCSLVCAYAKRKMRYRGHGGCVFGDGAGVVLSGPARGGQDRLAKQAVDYALQCCAKKPLLVCLQHPFDLGWLAVWLSAGG